MPRGREIKVQFEGHEIVLEFDPDKPIRHLKEMLQEETGLPVAQIKIYYSGPNREFDDDKTLRNYGLQFGAFFHMSDRTKDPTPSAQRRVSTPDLRHATLDYQAQKDRLQQRQQRRNTTIMSGSTTLPPATINEKEEDGDETKKKPTHKDGGSWQDDAKHEIDLAKQEIAAKMAAQKERLQQRQRRHTTTMLTSAPPPIVHVEDDGDVEAKEEHKPKKSSRKSISLPLPPSREEEETTPAPAKKINISIKTPTNGGDEKTINMQVEPTTDTTETIQEKIYQEAGIPIRHQILKDSNTGREIPLKGGKTIQDLGLQEGSQLTVDLAKVPITVRLPDGTEQQLMISPSNDTIADLQQQLEDKCGIPIHNQSLSMVETADDGTATELTTNPNKLIADCGIGAGSVLVLQPKTITITVKTPNGKTTIHIEAKPSSDTTEIIQEKIAKQTGIAVPHQDLTFNGTSMPTKSGKTLKDLGLQDGSEMQLDVHKIMMPVTVRTNHNGGEEEIQLMVDPTSDTIADLKQQLVTESGIPVNNQNLSLQGHELVDDKKLASDCGIEPGSVLDLEPKTITIAVKTPNSGKTIQVEARPSDTTDTIQELIAKQVGIPLQHQDLTYNGKSLPKGKTLKELGLQDGSEVNVDMRKMPVTVRTNNGKEIKILVDPTTDTIGDLKKQLATQSGIPKDNQSLSIQGSELLDDKKLASNCGIEAGSVLDLEPKTISISVKTPMGKTIQLEVKPTDTPSTIKHKIAQKTGMQVPQQVLKSNDGKELSSSKSVKELGIVDGSQLSVEVLLVPVTVRTNDGKEIKLMIDPTTNTIADMKQQLEGISGIPSSNQKLSLNGNELINPKETARACQIKAGTVLDLGTKTMHISVQTPKGKTISIKVEPSDTTEIIQDKMAKETGITVSQQVVKDSHGFQLQQGKTAKELGLKDGSQLSVDILQIPITVRTADGKQIQLTVDPNTDTITNLKEQLEVQSGVPASSQKLSMNGNEFVDGNKTLGGYGIEAGAVLDMEPKPKTLFVKTPTGKKIKIVVNPLDTTEDIKNKIEKDAGIPTSQQILRDCIGSELEGGKTVMEIGLADGSELSVCAAEIPLTVRTGTGKEIKLMVNPSADTIASMKKKIESEAGIPANNQKLSMNGKELDMARKLVGSCGIQAGSVLDLEPKSMTIQVKTPDGNSISVQVEPSFTSRSIKERLVREAGIPITQQVLEFNGKTFPNFKTVKDMGLKDGSELSVDVLKVPVTVRTHDGKEIQLMVNPSDDSIADLKQQLEGESGIPARRQKLSLLGSELAEPDRTAADCGILSGSVLDLEPQSMTIGIKAPGGKVISVEVQPSDSIDAIKERIAQEVGMEAPKQVLKLVGDELVNSKTVEDCGIQGGCILDLEPKTMTVAVKTTDGKSVSIQVISSDTAETIKEMVAQEVGIEVSQQLLTYNGKELANSTTVEDMGAKEEAVLVVERAKVPVTVNIPDGKQVNVMLDPKGTIGGLKTKLEEESGISCEEQRLSLEGTELSDPSKTVEECQIKPGSFMHLERKRLEKTAESQKKRLEGQRQSGVGAERQQSSDHKEDGQPKPELSEEKQRKCYMWYARMAQPTRESMIRRVKKLDKSCDITVEDVEALPWMYGGTILPVKEMIDLFMNG